MRLLRLVSLAAIWSWHGYGYSINTYWLRPRETVCFVDPRLSMFREAKTRETSTVEGQQNILFPEDTVNKYFIIYQKSKKWQTKANYIRKYMKYFISKINDVKFNLEQQQCQFCPKVASSRDGSRDFFRYSPVNNAFSPSRADARETV